MNASWHCIVLGSLMPALSVAAQTGESASIGEASPTAQAAEAARIDSIEIVVEDVFEDEATGTPSYWPYQTANRLHIETRESIIRQELLFAEGDVVDDEALQQTIRNLRALPYLRNARLETVPAGPGKVRVRVIASDSWSTIPGVRVVKVGNRWVWSGGLSERNLLGRGKQLSLFYDENLDRNEIVASYRDRRVLGSRLDASALVSKASDGHRVDLIGVRPFFSLATEWSFHTGYQDFNRLDPIYEAGERVESLRHRQRRADAGVAKAVRRRPSSALRLHLDYIYSDDHVADTQRLFGIVQVGISSIHHDFVTLTHVNKFERPEDINLGNDAGVLFGVSAPFLGGEPEPATFFALWERRGASLNPGGFLMGNVSWRARHQQGEFQNSIARARVDFVQKLALRRLLLAKAELRYGSDLDPEVQITLGADNGLRGFPVRQFVGNRSLLFSVETRFFLWDDVARLASLGVAAFVDSGFAWPEGKAIALHDLKSDVGISLLIGANRAAASRPAVRLDLAYALTPIPGLSAWLFSAGSQVGF